MFIKKIYYTGIWLLGSLSYKYFQRINLKNTNNKYTIMNKMITKLRIIKIIIFYDKIFIYIILYF